jgi:hypothetical protein
MWFWTHVWLCTIQWKASSTLYTIHWAVNSTVCSIWMAVSSTLANTRTALISTQGTRMIVCSKLSSSASTIDALVSVVLLNWNGVSCSLTTSAIASAKLLILHSSLERKLYWTCVRVGWQVSQNTSVSRVSPLSLFHPLPVYFQFRWRSLHQVVACSYCETL